LSMAIRSTQRPPAWNVEHFEVICGHGDMGGCILGVESIKEGLNEPSVVLLC
jgi:hypothetical protein